MSQHDFNIANQGFPATRADLNNALAALASSSSGTSEPSTTYAGQMWNDTTNNLLKFRNDANDAWITFAKLDQANNEWEVRSSVFQAVDSAGIAFKTDEGTTRATLGDDGNWVFTGGATFSGTLEVQNISDGTDTVETGYVVNGSAKAWCNWKTDGTQSIYASLNIASITDIGVGSTRVSYTTVMDSSNYANILNSSQFMASTSNSSKAAGSCDCFTYSNSFSAVDSPQVSVSTHGDLA
jgi:hypothetical protein